jgi:dTMP kinase
LRHRSATARLDATAALSGAFSTRIEDRLVSRSHITVPGRLIAIEGIDGSGKRTQLDLLEKSLQAAGIPVHSTGFPRYDSWFGKMVGQFLNGELGSLESVDPHFTALLYAGDRFEAKSSIEGALDEGKIVLIDRYIGSNLAHQTARVAPDKREDFRCWIRHLEYEIYNLPREDRTIYLRVPPGEAQKLVNLKAERTYTAAKRDLLEASLRHLQDAADMYDLLSRDAPWITIQCFDSPRNAIRPPQDIAQEVWAAVQPVITAQATVSRPASGIPGDH